MKPGLQPGTQVYKVFTRSLSLSHDNARTFAITMVRMAETLRPPNLRKIHTRRRYENAQGKEVLASRRFAGGRCHLGQFGAGTEV
jgi:ribosomal protein L34